MVRYSEMSLKYNSSKTKRNFLPENKNNMLMLKIICMNEYIISYTYTLFILKVLSNAQHYICYLKDFTTKYSIRKLFKLYFNSFKCIVAKNQYF